MLIAENVMVQLRREMRQRFGRYFVPSDGGGRLGTVWPRSVDEVQEVVLLTRYASVPLILRGAGSNPFSGAEPGTGLVVCFDNLNRLLSIDRGRRLATVQPGTIWHTLIHSLAEHRMMPRVYPSSESYSTVGGFVAQGGVGIGSYQFGDIGGNVSGVKLVDANGELREVGDEGLPLVIGAEGRTGLLVEITLRLWDGVPMTPLVASFPSFEQAYAALRETTQQPLPLWSLNVLNPLGVVTQSRERPELALPVGYAVLFTYPEHAEVEVGPALERIVSARGGRLLAEHGNAGDRLVQFASLQALGTTPIPLQVQLPFERLPALVQRAVAALGGPLAAEIIIVDGGREAAVRCFLPERPAGVQRNAEQARRLLALAAELGGASYSTGGWFASQAEAVFGAERLQRIAAFRREIDPDNRLNPGRGFA